MSAWAFTNGQKSVKSSRGPSSCHERHSWTLNSKTDQVPAITEQMVLRNCIPFTVRYGWTGWVRKCDVWWTLLYPTVYSRTSTFIYWEKGHQKSQQRQFIILFLFFFFWGPKIFILKLKMETLVCSSFESKPTYFAVSCPAVFMDTQHFYEPWQKLLRHGISVLEGLSSSTFNRILKYTLFKNIDFLLHY